MFGVPIYDEETDFGVREEYDDSATPEKFYLVDESGDFPEDTAYIEAEIQDTNDLEEMR